MIAKDELERQALSNAPSSGDHKGWALDEVKISLPRTNQDNIVVHPSQIGIDCNSTQDTITQPSSKNSNESGNTQVDPT